MAAWEKRTVDMRDRAAKRDLQAAIGALHGDVYEVQWKRRVRGRTLSQNAAYWACVVPALVAGIREQWGENVTGEQAHRMLKERHLKVETRHVDEDTGEIRCLEYVRSTTELDAQEFTEYMDACSKFILEWFGISVVIGYD